MTKLSELSDFEINKRVAIATGQNIKFIFLDDDDNEIGVFIGKKGCREKKVFNPCNNPTDAWPIIVENRIGIIPAPDDGKWRAAHRKTGEDSTPYHFTEHTNPLRAAMIVFLEMHNDSEV